jgi:hypothetical protein
MLSIITIVITIDIARLFSFFLLQLPRLLGETPRLRKAEKEEKIMNENVVLHVYAINS